MEPTHSLLLRQLRRHRGEQTAIPADWQRFISAVNTAYHEFDIDREMLERSLEISSQELLQANAELRAVFQALPDLVFRIDHQGKILSFKAGTTSDLLLEPQEMEGRRIQDIPFGGIGSLFWEAIQRTISTKSMVSIEYALDIKGQTCFFESRMVPLRTDQIIIIIRNITERKKAEDALRKAEEKYRNIVENAVEGIFQCEPAGRIVEANLALSKMLGYESPAALMAAIGNIAEQLFADPARHAEFTRIIEANGVVQRFEARVLRQDGKKMWISINARLARDRDGKVLFHEGTVEDITERKRLEEQFRQAQKMDAFGQLAGGVAHDFNNILTVIQGNVSFLRMATLPPAEHAAALDEINHAAERASNLTRQLLTFSRRQPMQPAALDLNAAVSNMTKMLQRIIGEHISLENRYAPGSTPVLADQGMLEQALMNLVVNSRDAMPKGGRLILETAIVAITEEEAHSKPKARPGTFVRLSVIDTGIGISPESLPHIFEPFFTTKDVGKGTGLGLATVFGIVEQHGGWIEVESRANEGTIVRLYLPRLAQTATVAPAPSNAKTVRGGHETILLVEDEAAVRALMRALLERNGYRVFAAASGVAALMVWQEQHASIDLMITDMVMPGGIGGRELADRLQAEKSSLKVIHCSGHADGALGPDSPMRQKRNFLEKPFDHHVFLQRVRECLDAR